MVQSRPPETRCVPSMEEDNALRVLRVLRMSLDGATRVPSGDVRMQMVPSRSRRPAAHRRAGSRRCRPGCRDRFDSRVPRRRRRSRAMRPSGRPDGSARCRRVRRDLASHARRALRRRPGS
jgi:hypothetical protein